MFYIIKYSIKMKDQEKNDNNSDISDQPEKFVDEEVDPCLINIILWVSNIFHNIQECCFRIYSSNTHLKSSIDNISYCSKWSYNTLLQKRTEPNELNWLSICRTTEENELLEEFIYENNYGVPIERYDFLIFRNDNYILSSINGLLDKYKPPIFSEIRFLSIEYCHPDMPQPIQIVLEKEWYVKGNEVLGHIHILRMLEYQFIKSEYVFDGRYIVKIIDSDINILEIGENNYIRLEKEGYVVL